MAATDQLMCFGMTNDRGIGCGTQRAPGFRAFVLLVPGSGVSGWLSVLFLLCGLRLFDFLLLLSFGLVLLAFSVAHGMTPLWRGQMHFAAWVAISATPARYPSPTAQPLPGQAKPS